MYTITPTMVLLTLRAPTPVHDGNSQSVKVQMRLRELIFGGELHAGARVTEMAVVQRLGVSRTPIRAALTVLEQEGLLERYPSGGYAVRTFSEADISDAIELRGTIEGLAARLAAKKGVHATALTQAIACLDSIDALLVDTDFDSQAFSKYVELNREFHAYVGGLAESAVLTRELERITAMPFASPSSFVLVQSSGPIARDMLLVAQYQHRQVIDALLSRDGARAEAVLQEHARLAKQNLLAYLNKQKMNPLDGSLKA